jgi:uncharacterized RDD family membrane protein YckC
MTDPTLQQKRLIAAAIDIGVLIVLNTAMAIIAVGLNCLAASAHVPFLMRYGVQAVWALCYVLVLLYVVARDVLAGGRSIGKKFMDIRVVTDAGAPITVMESVKRNLVFAPSFVLGLLGLLLNLIPFVGWILSCAVAIVNVFAGLLALGLGIWEVVEIVRKPDGARIGDRMAGTRVIAS